MNTILKYFPDITEEQTDKFNKLGDLYREWNDKINVISRKDIDSIYEKHILHSLSIAKVIQFTNGTTILDVGTGGGFPTIPLAILFPNVKFKAVDSIGKKIKVVNGVAEALGLNNVSGEHIRVQSVKEKYDFVISRAVTAFPKFVAMSRSVVKKGGNNTLANGIIYIKGGDFLDEIKPFPKAEIFNIPDHFTEPFFETKKIIHLPL